MTYEEAYKEWYDYKKRMVKESTLCDLCRFNAGADLPEVWLSHA